MKHAYTLFLRCLLLIGCISWVVPFTSSAQNYSFKNFSIQDGLSQSQVYSMCQDQRGYLWLGTRGGGLSRYNGKFFLTLNKKNGLVSNTIDVVHANQDQLFVATPDGISVVQEQKITNIPFSKKNIICSGILEQKNQLYIATNKGLFQLEKNTLRQLDSTEWISACCIGNTTWLSSKHKIYRRDEQGLIPQGAINQADIQTILAYQHDLFIGTYGEGMYCLHSGKITTWHPEILNKQVILSMYIDKFEHLWIATLNSGVFCFDQHDQLINHLTEEQGLCKNHIRSIVQDNEGNYWFGSSGNGISYYAQNSFKHWDIHKGLPGNFIYSVFKDNKQRLWIGADAKGITCVTTDSIKNYHGSNGFGNFKVRAICEDKQGKLYFGTEGNGCYVFDNNQFKPVFNDKKIYIRALCCDSKNDLYLATADQGIIKINCSPRGNFLVQRYDITNGLKNNRISYVYCDKQQRIWFADEEYGLGRIESNNTLRYFSQLPLQSKIRTIVEDNDHHIWCATESDGVFVVNKEGILLPSDINVYLQSSTIYQLGFHPHQGLLVGSGTGMDVIHFNHQLHVTHYKHYTKGDGFLGIETNLNALFVDGQSFFSGTINGLEQFTSSKEYIQRTAPSLFLQEIRVNFEPIRWNQSSDTVLRYNQNRIQLDFDAVSLANADNLAFQWRMNGYDDTWLPVTKEHKAAYTNLNPGNYTFEVRACNQDSVWTSVPIQWHFSIQPVWWQRQWIKAAGLLLFLISVWIAYKVRVQHVKKKANQKLKQLKLENELSTLEHTALRLQMNPHFIFNAMNSIQSVIGHERNEDARYYMAKFSKLMRQILNNSRQSEITLEEEIATLENYLLVEQFTNSIPFTYNMVVDELIDTDFITIPPMIVQPFVENALKHGLRYLNDRTGKIDIRFAMKEHVLYGFVLDNGVGLEASRIMQEQSKEPKHPSVAIEVTRKRLLLLNPKNSIIIQNRSDQPGTEVIITIHLNSQS